MSQGQTWKHLHGSGQVLGSGREVKHRSVRELKRLYHPGRRGGRGGPLGVSLAGHGRGLKGGGATLLEVWVSWQHLTHPHTTRRWAFGSAAGLYRGFSGFNRGSGTQNEAACDHRDEIRCGFLLGL